MTTKNWSKYLNLESIYQNPLKRLIIVNQIKTLPKVIPHKIIYQLDFAQKQLLHDTIPWQLRVKFYIRVACTKLEQYDYLTPNTLAKRCHSLSYLELLQLLIKRDRQWWAKCYLTQVNTVESSDRIISELLYNINQIYRQVNSNCACFYLRDEGYS